MWQYHAAHAEDALRARNEFLVALADEAHTQMFDRFRAQLIFTELVGNAVRHARGPVDLQLRCVAGKALFQVYDRGPGFELRAALPVSAMSEGGRGLFLVTQFAERVRVHSLAGHGTCVSAMFSLAA